MAKWDWKQWGKAAGMRALKTLAQAAIAALPATAFTLGSVDWVVVASTAGGAAVLSLLTSVAGLPEVPVQNEDEAEAEDVKPVVADAEQADEVNK